MVERGMSLRALAGELLARRLRVTDIMRVSLEARAAAAEMNAWVEQLPEEAAMKAAKAADKRWKAKEPLSVIDGLPIAIKDNFCTRSGATTACSNMLKGWKAGYDATAVSRLKHAGGVIVGKTNMDEFGMGNASAFSAFGAVRHPSAPDFVPGGSSGGSAAAVAASAVVAALGSDTGGSVRQPASFCGIVGLKPSYGRISRHGLISYASSLDTPGLLTRCADDAAVLLSITAGEDDNDSTCMRSSPPAMPFGDVATDLTGLRVGLPTDFFVEELHEDTLAAWRRAADALEAAGASVEEVSLPHMRYALPAYYVIATAEAASNLARYDGVRYGHRSDSGHEQGLHGAYTRWRSEAFGAEVARRILVGNFVLSAEAHGMFYDKAVSARKALADDFAQLFQSRRFHLLCAPTAPAAAWPAQPPPQGVEAYLNDVMTIPASLAGLPAISLPAGSGGPAGLPIGVQLMAAAGDDATLLHAAGALEAALAQQ